MSAPTHAKEHDDLMTLLTRASADSKTILATILVTIGVDGRPWVGSSLLGPAQVTDVFAKLGAAGNMIVDVTDHVVPKSH